VTKQNKFFFTQWSAGFWRSRLEVKEKKKIKSFILFFCKNLSFVDDQQPLRPLPGNTNWRGEAQDNWPPHKDSKIYKKEEIFLYYEKQLISTSWYKEVNRTEPFPSDRLPWHLPFLSFFLLKTLIWTGETGGEKSFSGAPVAGSVQHISQKFIQRTDFFLTPDSRRTWKENSCPSRFQNQVEHLLSPFYFPICRWTNVVTTHVCVIYSSRVISYGVFSQGNSSALVLNWLFMRGATTFSVIELSLIAKCRGAF